MGAGGREHGRGRRGRTDSARERDALLAYSHNYTSPKQKKKKATKTKEADSQAARVKDYGRRRGKSLQQKKRAHAAAAAGGNEVAYGVYLGEGPDPLKPHDDERSDGGGGGEGGDDTGLVETGDETEGEASL